MSCMNWKEQSIHTRSYREALQQDLQRPGYHFVIPDSNGHPFDPNGAFFADGVYHIMYLYRNDRTNAYHWAHLSSIDLLHWRHHADALTTSEGDEGAYSGGAFVDEDATAYLSFWKFKALDPEKDKSGMAIAWAKPPYETWTRMEPIAVNASRWGVKDVEIDGKVLHLGCTDPSNIWKENGYYYMQAGNKPPLKEFGECKNPDPYYQGCWSELYRSKDLKDWEYVHRFHENNLPGEDWPDKTEDDMCPSFLPLYDAQSGGRRTDKWLQLFISHNKGCQYFVGTLQNERLIPEVHGRMSWVDNTCFAPEALVDDRGRQIMWAWLRDDTGDNVERGGWSGTWTLPRTLWWEDGALHMAPAEELERLQYRHKTVADCSCGTIPVQDGDSFRMKVTICPGQTEEIGFRVRENPKRGEYTFIGYNPASKKLVVDAVCSGTLGKRRREEAPLTLADGEALELDIFVDRSAVEVFANRRQAIARRIFPTDPAQSMGVSVVGNTDAIRTLDMWSMFPCNMY